jgi:hypothetical protein
MQRAFGMSSPTGQRTTRAPGNEEPVMTIDARNKSRSSIYMTDALPPSTIPIDS